MLKQNTAHKATQTIKDTFRDECNTQKKLNYPRNRPWRPVRL
jgi:hypothetical protein